jgi:hypothetical protein
MPTEEKSVHRKGTLVGNCGRYETTDRSLVMNLRLFMKIEVDGSNGKVHST